MCPADWRLLRRVPSAMPQLSLDLINEAREFLRPRIRRTPVEASPRLSAKLGVLTSLKLESLQITGSFKIRGAFFRLSRATEAERRGGIVTCSAGNHGKAIAYAARELGLRATIFVPKGVDQAKYRGMVSFGANVIVSPFPGYDETEELALEDSRKNGRAFVSAFDDAAVMAGNGGTLAAEIVEDLPDVKTFIVPVGGGGLSAGLALYVKEKVPAARVIGCQHEVTPALRLSLERGSAVTRMPSGETLAAGIEGGIGTQTFEVLRTRVDDTPIVNDAEICDAVRWMVEEHQYLIEPTAAATLAACLAGKIAPLTAPAVVVISGRNVSSATVRKILCI
jgi:threonine dehydratase